MNTITKLILASAFSSVALAGFSAMNVGPYSLIPNHRFNKPMFSAMTSPLQAAPSYFDIYATNNAVGNEATRGALEDPIDSFTKIPDYTELYTPKGTYFVTIEYDNEYNYVNEYYTEVITKGFTLTFYDPQFNLAGTIKDKINFDEAKGESATAHCILDNYVSTNFFNDDDNLEIMVYLGIKTGPNFDYHPNFYEKVYSLGGEKDADGNDKCIYTFEGRLVDTISNGTEDGTYLSFVNDKYYSAKDYSDPVERANATTTTVSVYGKGDGEPELVMQKDIKMVTYPGDTTDGIYIITKEANGVPYFFFSHYEKPYFVNPLGGATDESATANNNFLIETYKITGKNAELVNTTSIPVVIPQNDEKLMYAFYSIGSLGWKNDIDLVVNGSPEAPAFIVRTDVTEAADLESATSSYDIYNAQGKLVRNVVGDAESFTVLNSAGSKEPHVMFVTFDDNGDYVFKFVDLYSGNVVMTIPQVYEGESLMASAERIKDGDGYKYAILLQNDYIDDDYVAFKRVAWFDDKGNLDHIDKINMGKDIQASILYMSPTVLDPYLFDNDPGMEYAVLVKRTYGETVRNEFLIVDDSGEWYANFSADDGKGDPVLFTVVPAVDGNKLYMTYNDGRNYTIDVYNLPFESLGVDSILDSDNNQAYFAGDTIIANGAEITIYTLGGVKTLSGRDALSTASLAKGVYIAVINSGKGKPSAIKFTK